uniref:Uncharacterized protein n=2 Tax=Noccaea caerulescens TaxID=107243 RepID=A0A1J3JTD3_NOCCA
MIFETPNNSVTFFLSAKTGEREANIRFSCEVVEGEKPISGNINDCNHGGIILVHLQVVVVTFVVQVLSVGCCCIPKFILIFSDGVASIIVMNGQIV